MLELKVQSDDREVVLRFEHSLLSLSKWEARTGLAFLTTRTKAPTEMIEYFQDMLVSPEDDPSLVYGLSPEQLDRLSTYINEPQTASSVPDDGLKKFNSEITTSELVYAWLTMLKIPFHPTETWHLSRCMMLVQIVGYKQQPPKKRKAGEVMTDWMRLNEERKKRYNTTG